MYFGAAPAVSSARDGRQVEHRFLMSFGLRSLHFRGIVGLGRERGPEAFLSHSDLAFPMARFPEAERRRLHKMICMQCYARNAMRATRCRKCGSRELRPKAKEARKE